MAALDWASSSDASTTGFSRFDVFLNFRGEDTRKNFTSFLKLLLKDRGINAFIDSEHLWVGEPIGPALGRAIKVSKISNPIFSKGYADSKWCLRELDQIVRCHRSDGQIIVPIFFDVEPSQVRNQTGSFEKAFQEHEKNFDPDTVKTWREVLTVVGNLKGFDLDKNKVQAEVAE
ncbi:disease resistance protein L6-like [Telopea speciosissima]|uniref:disease resistance protein L6-like n=1 Tax=Telopea speciosissima TaxID=54955 RepID=UPI001CC50635|nr:disease resistance protein L6-like [Telopea speciosissima]